MAEIKGRCNSFMRLILLAYILLSIPGCGHASVSEGLGAKRTTHDEDTIGRFCNLSTTVPVGDSNPHPLLAYDFYNCLTKVTTAEDSSCVFNVVNKNELRKGQSSNQLSQMLLQLYPKLCYQDDRNSQSFAVSSFPQFEAFAAAAAYGIELLVTALEFNLGTPKLSESLAYNDSASTFQTGSFQTGALLLGYPRSLTDADMAVQEYNRTCRYMQQESLLSFADPFTGPEICPYSMLANDDNNLVLFLEFLKEKGPVNTTIRELYSSFVQNELLAEHHHVSQSIQFISDTITKINSISASVEGILNTAYSDRRRRRRRRRDVSTLDLSIPPEIQEAKTQLEQSVSLIPESHNSNNNVNQEAGGGSLVQSIGSFRTAFKETMVNIHLAVADVGRKLKQWIEANFVIPHGGSVAEGGSLLNYFKTSQAAAQDDANGDGGDGDYDGGDTGGDDIINRPSIPRSSDERPPMDIDRGPIEERRRSASAGTAWLFLVPEEAYRALPAYLQEYVIAQNVEWIRSQSSNLQELQSQYSYYTASTTTFPTTVWTTSSTSSPDPGKWMGLAFGLAFLFIVLVVCFVEYRKRQNTLKKSGKYSGFGSEDTSDWTPHSTGLDVEYIRMDDSNDDCGGSHH